MLKPSGGFLKKIFSAPAKAAGAIAGGAKKMGGAIAGGAPAPKKNNLAGATGMKIGDAGTAVSSAAPKKKGIFAKAIAGKKMGV